MSSEEEKEVKEKKEEKKKKEIGEVHKAVDDVIIKPGDYRIQVQLLEAKEIIPHKSIGMSIFSNNEGSCDPIVDVKVAGQSKKSEHQNNTLSPIFNETLYFELNKMSETELEQAVIDLSLYDYNALSTNSFIGKFTIDAAYIYQMNPDHELYRKWVILTDTTDATEGVKGYLRVTINVLGPGDRPPVHNEMKDLKSKGDDGENNIFSPGHVEKRGMLMKMNLYKAEHLPPTDLYNNKTDSYVKVSFAGVGIRSKEVPDERNPVYNQQLQIPVVLPCMNSKIRCEVWDADWGRDERTGTFIATFPTNDKDRKPTESMWVNMYGPPFGVMGDKADYMTKYSNAGTHYTGRVLYSLEYEARKDPKKSVEDIEFEIPDNPPPNPPERVYILRVDLFNGFELPESIRKASIHITCGPYKASSPVVKVKECCATWNHVFADMKITAPVEISQIYDVIIYLSTSKKEKDRICFLRIPAKDALYSLNPNLGIQKFTLVEDISKDAIGDEEFPGILNMRLTLFDKNPMRRPKNVFPPEERMHEYYQDYILRVYLYMGRDLPAADDTGLADPFIILRCAGAKKQSTTKKETLNPGWFETVEMKINIPKVGNSIFPEPSVSLLCYDEDSFGRKDLLGRALMEMKGEQKVIEEKNREVEYSLFLEPTWHELYFDALKEQKGYLLAGFGLLEPEVAESYPPISILPPSIPCTLRVVCIGIRDLIDSINIVPLKRLSLKFDVSGDTHEAMESNKHPVRYNSCNIGEILDVPIDIPLNPLYSPVLSVYVYDHILGLIGTRLIGISHIPLSSIVRKTLRGFLERKNKLGYKERDSLERSIQFAELSQRARTVTNNEFHGVMMDEAALNKSLKKLQIMIDRGQVDLNSLVSGITEENAIEDVLKDMERRDKEANGSISGREIVYEFTDEDYEDIESYLKEDLSMKESEEEESSSEEVSLHSKSSKQSERESTIKSDDIVLENEESESEESNEEEESRGSRGYSRIREKSPKKNKKSKKKKKDYEKLDDSDSRYTTETQPKLTNDKSGANNLISKKGREKGIQSKQTIERALSGYSHRKDKVKKVAIQKMLHNKFRQKAKEDAIAAEERKKKEKEKYEEIYKNDEKKKKMKTKRNKKISTPAEDTDPEEDLSLLPDYLVDRDIYEDELEEAIIKKKPFNRSNILSGQTRGQKGWFFKKVVNTQSVSGVLKGIPVIQMPDDDPQELYNKYKRFLVPTNLVCRVYILKGKSLTPKDSRNSDPYIIIKCGSKVINDEKNVIDDTNNPGFYKHFDISVSIPGASTLKIQVWDDDGIVGDDLIGETKIDLEERWFSKEWRIINDAANVLDEREFEEESKEEVKSQEANQNKESLEEEKKETLEEEKKEKDDEEEKEEKDQEKKKEEVKEVKKKNSKEEKKSQAKKKGSKEQISKVKPKRIIKKIPIEERTLTSITSAAPQGILECWIELMSAKEAKQRTPTNVCPFPKKPMEIRVIVWGTKDVKFLDTAEKCNDLYVKGIFGKKELETDTHWRCRGNGSFNWRWKYKTKFPFDYDEEYGRNVLTFSLWDRDVTKSNEMICECRLDLNDYNTLIKSYKRGKSVKMLKNLPNKKKKSDRMWLLLTHPDRRDDMTGEYEPQGYLEVSVEIMPQEEADDKQNGFGRESPNMFPHLPKPTGRFQFDLFSPWKMLKELLGPALARKVAAVCCCIICCLVLFLFFYFFGWQLVTSIIF
ncbi:unnamed protein product [Moneuplotes crassus]|uniref:C2 domain-containing protein n=1 Tax=Euplotes crassus TaxID=5936 RepID=A0AAD1Y315_EUPCR|nr:unnamed protein product [Moneuplotes crassus]